MCASGRQGTHLDTQALRHAVYVASFWTESGSPCAALQPPPYHENRHDFQSHAGFPALQRLPVSERCFSEGPSGRIAFAAVPCFPIPAPRWDVTFQERGQLQGGKPFDGNIDPAQGILLAERGRKLNAAAGGKLLARDGDPQPSDSMSAKRAV